MRRRQWLAGALLVGMFLAGLLPVGLSSAAGAPTVVSAQTDVMQRVTELGARVSQLEARMNKSTGAAVAFLFGAFCALWAQNTKRSPWAWFFLGLFFSVIAVLVLLTKNADDLKAARGAAVDGSLTPILAGVLGLLLIVAFFLLLWWAGA